MYIDTYLYHEIFVNIDVISVGIFIDNNYEKLNRLVISFILVMEEELDPKFFLLSLHLCKKCDKGLCNNWKTIRYISIIFNYYIVIFLEAL